MQVLDVKKVMLYRPDGSMISDKPVAVIARLNGIAAKDVPALVAAWERMGAIDPRRGGGFTVKRMVAAGDPYALRLMLEAPHAKPSVAR